MSLTMDFVDHPSCPSRPVFVRQPERQTVPVVFASPHSGRDYLERFIAMSRLDPQSLRRSEDSFVDELFASAPRHGAPLLAALFPRAYCDANREAYELDPAMFSGPLPGQANSRSARVVAGLGTIARVVASGAEIYKDRLPISEIELRLDHCYRPYHQTLRRLLDQTVQGFGRSLLVDCHSMPSVGGPMDRDNGLTRVDVVLGDCFGSSCDPVITALVEEGFARRGYKVVRNTPYAGGFSTRHYGQPRQGSHALQIEINRAVYMNESTHQKLADFAGLADDIDRIIKDLAHWMGQGGWR